MMVKSIQKMMKKVVDDKLDVVFRLPSLVKSLWMTVLGVKGKEKVQTLQHKQDKKLAIIVLIDNVYPHGFCRTGWVYRW